MSTRHPATAPTLPTPAPKKLLRVAIYCRKSTEEGLDQPFTSLDAQRESAEAYITSQKNEGWRVIPDRFEDGGYTGANMERPALQRLMREIQAGNVDVVAVYKIDRLSRSLLDFSKILAVFEAHNVAFISVTQRFSTADSMGRLMMNVLLSFAQFEREVIGERIRDKLAAQRRKGRWTGGYPVLGYDVDRSGIAPRLAANQVEAKRVCTIFELYLELGSLLPVVQELDRRGWKNKAWLTKGGVGKGGQPFDRGSLYALLTNPLYTGNIRYKTEVHPGEHQAIVPDDTFRRVQTQLQQHGRSGGAAQRNKHGALLRGLLHCTACRRAMFHTFTTRGTKRYRYYTCSASTKKGRGACPSGSLPAAEIERAVVDEIRLISTDPTLRAEVIAAATAQGRSAIATLQTERLGLERSLRRWQEEIRRVAVSIRATSTGTARLSEDRRVRGGSRMIATGVHAKLDCLESRLRLNGCRLCHGLGGRRFVVEWPGEGTDVGMLTRCLACGVSPPRGQVRLIDVSDVLTWGMTPDELQLAKARLTGRNVAASAPSSGRGLP